MAQATWEKVPSAVAEKTGSRLGGGRWKFVVGLLLILGAVGYLVVSGTLGGARFFITVDDLMGNREAYAGQTVRVSGAVVGDTIRYDSENLIIEFTVANVPAETDDIGTALHVAVNDPDATRMQVRVEGQVKPELLQHEAQAIMTGTLGSDGVFHVSELNLKCPSRFIESQPDQSIAQPQV
jgi:cytochrome c-type biogenesis protein CcmE